MLISTTHWSDAHRLWRLEANILAEDFLVNFHCERLVLVRLGVEEVKLVGHDVGVESLLLQVDFFKLTSSGHVDFLEDPQELRARVRRQRFAQILAQLLEVQRLLGVGNRDHSSASLDVYNLHSVHDAIAVAGLVADLRFNFTGAAVLALPAERVAGSVHEEKISTLVGRQNVAGQERRIAFLEHVADDFLAGRGLVHIAQESSRRVVRNDFANEHAGLVGLAQLAESVGASDGLASVLIRLNDGNWINRRNDSGNEADGADHVVHINDVRVSFSCAVKLAHLRDVEAFDELRPNLRSQTVAENHSEVVRRVGLLAGRRQAVAAHFTDVLGDLKRRS